ncbi:MAG: hypothetical protein HWE25_02010 [Alphaproteobacteria bacterium]|nr:hypothetical protein [Alphaproteobacteria bacterium]
MSNWVEYKTEIKNSFWEVGITVLCTFVPFLVISVPLFQGSGQLPFFDAFLTYWKNGQLVLPIIATCGALISLITLHSEKFSSGYRVFMMVSLLSLLLMCGTVLNGSNSFTNALDETVFIAGFLIYLAMIITWLVTLIYKGTYKTPTRGTEARAEQIINEKNERRKRAEGEAQ